MTRTGGNTPPPWLWPNLLGLDAPAVAVSWQLLFSRAFDTEFPVVLHVILGLSVWCIYLADRLYDTMRTDVTASGTDRLKFTRRYFKPLALALAIASAANLALIIRYVPGNLIIAGLITSFLLGTYYAIRLKRGTKVASLIPREILCGMLFSLGCVITPHAYADSGASDLGFWLAALLFGLICSTSCILISIWEREEDLAASDSSIATISPRIVPFMAGAVSLIAVTAACMVIFIPWQLCLPVALSALAQRIILHFDDHLSKPMLRVLGDAVLLTPLVFLWF
jgi:hypothetical protein